jgi:uncharacterized protein (DUF1778 family)
MPGARNDARLNFRLSGELKKTIEDAAAELGQSVSDFALATLARKARSVLRDQATTRIGGRDRKRFMQLLDDTSTEPNEALSKAARRYRKQVG